jgi:hypothetical protein
MKTLVALLLLLAAAVAPAAAGEIGRENRPQVVFPGPRGGVVHQSPYPQSSRSATVWNADACWRECNASCTWKLEYCIKAADSNAADTCRPYLDACDRACHRSCRAWWQGPLLGFLDF